MRQIMSQEVWDDFLAYRLRKGRFTWHFFEQADGYVEKEEYLPIARRVASGGALSIPRRTVINKMGSGKKRVVYQYPQEEKSILKIISFLLYRYDDRFASNCYSFRRGMRACDAVLKINKTLGGRSLWAYKVDIHDYFNSISIPLLMPILHDLLSDDPELYSFFKSMLEDNRSLDGETVIRENRGVMAGTPTAPFLADVYLMEVDKYFEKEGILYARYSDDIILFASDYEELLAHKAVLTDFFRRYRLEVNPAKEKVYAPGEPYEFLGFRSDGKKIGVSKSTIEKMKGKISRKARSLNRWASKKGIPRVQAMKAMIGCFNAKFFEGDDPDSLSWSRWFFPVINTAEGLEEIDHYLQENIRFLSTGKHNKANFRVRYEDLKSLGYRSLVHEYHRFREK